MNQSPQQHTRHRQIATRSEKTSAATFQLYQLNLVECLFIDFCIDHQSNKVDILIKLRLMISDIDLKGDQGLVFCVERAVS